MNKCQSWPKVDELRAKFEMKKITEKTNEKPKMLDEKAIENYDEKIISVESETQLHLCSLLDECVESKSRLITKLEQHGDENNDKVEKDEKLEEKIDEKLLDEYDPLYDNEALFKGNFAKYRNFYDKRLKNILNHDVLPTIGILDKNVMKKESLMKKC